MPLTNAQAETVAREQTFIFFRHSYLPQTILTDLGTSSVSALMHELMKLLEVKLDRASLKDPKTVVVVERSHSALKPVLKLKANEECDDWYKYFSLVTFIHKISYLSAIGSSPTVLYHSRQPFEPLDLRFNKTMIEQFSNIECVRALQDAMNKKFSETKLILREMYNRYRAYCDCLAEMKPLLLFSYCVLSNP